MKIQRRTLAGEVRAEIERRMLSGELASGQKLNELQLADSLGVSRGTVREAIRSLADSGMIELISNRGAFVRKLSVDEIRNLYELRGAVFGMGCASIARRMNETRDPALITALEASVRDMRTAFEGGDAPTYYELNIAFHDMLLVASQNAKAKSVYDSLVKELHLFRRQGLSVLPNIERSVAEHDAIVVAIKAGDVNGARAAATAHVESGLGRFLKTIET